MEPELLFFDTFVHDGLGDVNLDLVQFPRPVSIKEVRVIPLGSKIEGDFPGGSRMGATNPSSFVLDLYVNNLAKPASCVFEHLGSLHYSQNSNINVHFNTKNCVDGLVIIGKFAIVTLAIYGNEVPVVVESPVEERVPSAIPLQSEAAQHLDFVPEKEAVIAEFHPESEVEMEVQADFSERGRVHERNYRKHSASEFEEEEDRRKRVPQENDFLLRSPTPPSLGRMAEIQSPTSEELYQDRRCVKMATPVESQREEYVPEAPPRLEEPVEMEEIEAEDFEEILSDEDIMDEFEYQEAETEIADYGEEFIKTFSPDSFEVKKYTYLADPSATQFATQIRQLHCFTDEDLQRIQTSGEKLQQLLMDHHWEKEVAGVGEKFVVAVEQATRLLPDGLVYLAALTLQDPEAGHVLETAERVLFDWLFWSLDFEKAMAEPQPIFKVRHMKAGLKFAQVIPQCSDRLFLSSLDNLFGRLFDLYNAEYMALSLKLSCLHAIDAAISTPQGMERLLKNREYDVLCGILLDKQPSRAKAAVAALLTKVNLFEAANELHNSVVEISRMDKALDREKMDSISRCLGEIVKVMSNPKVFFGQHGRFLPAQTVMEVPDANDYWTGIYSILKCRKFIHSLLILSVHPALSTNGELSSKIETMFEILADTDHGLRFLGSESQVTTLVVRQFMHVYDQIKGEEFGPEDVQTDSATSFRLGNVLAHRLYVLQCLDVVHAQQKTYTIEPDCPTLVSALQSLQNLVFTPAGKLTVVTVLSMKDHIKPILNYARIDENAEREAVLRNSAVRGYAIDLVDTVVKHSQNMDFYKNHGEALLDLAKQHEQAKLNGLIPWLEIVVKPEMLTNAGLQDLISIVKAAESDCTTYPPRLLMAVRILCSLSVPPKFESNREHSELKYSYAVVELFSASMMTTFMTILTKCTEHYNQPSWYAPSLSGNQGACLVELVYPILQILRCLINDVVKCRKTDFHDLTPISPLLRVYELLSAVPASCFLHPQAQSGCYEIVQILLVYTHPIIQVDVGAVDDLLVKSLWTQMVHELLKNVLSGTASHFLTGLHVLSELLPYPLPITASGTNEGLSEEYYLEQLNARKLWSAHIHSLLPQISTLLETLSPTAYSPLQTILRRVAVQIADLASATAVAIVRTLLDALLKRVATCTEKSKEEGKIVDPFLEEEAPSASSLLMSNLSGIVPKLPILNLLCYVTSFPCGKAALLQLVQNKDDKYGEMLELLLALLTKTPRKYLQIQENLLTILQCLADTEVSMTGIRDDESGLGNALPNKDSLVAIISGLLDYLRTCEGQFQLVPITLRIISYLCERNQTFGLVVRCFRESPSVLPDFIRLLARSVSQDSSDSIQSLVSLLELLRLFSQPTIHTDPEMVPPRSFFLPMGEVSAVCGGFGSDPPLVALLSAVQGLGEDLSQVKKALEVLVEDLRKSKPLEKLTDLPEFSVLPSEALINQWATRIVVTQISTPVQTMIDEEKLTGPAWFAAQLSDETEIEMDQERCDILELTKILLPEWNFMSDVEQVCKVEEPIGIVGRGTKSESSDVGFGTKGQEKTLPIMSTIEGQKRPFVAPLRGRGFNRGMNTRNDSFRLRPSNTSRPPSLHVDDFVAMETNNAPNYGKDTRNRRPARGGFAGDKPRFNNEPQFRPRGGGPGRPPGSARNSGPPRQGGQQQAGPRPPYGGGGFRGGFGDRRGGRGRPHWEDRPGRGGRRENREGYGPRNFQR